MELDDVLNEKQEAKEEAPEQKEVETVSSSREAHRERERAAQEVKAEEPKVEEPKVEVKPEVKPEVKAEVKEEMTEKERAFLAQARDERNKRQQLEKQLHELQSKEPPKQFWDDPESKFNEFEQKMGKVVMDTRLNTAEMIARSKYQDFDEKLNIFGNIVQNTPGLWERAMAASDPAEFAYRTAKNYKDLHDAGNLDSLKANMEKELRLKIEAELKTKKEADEKQRAELPSSLSEARGTTGNKVAWGGPTPLDNILHD